MLIQLYEEVINEDGTRTLGRIVGKIRCNGDGTPGEFIFFDTCNEIWDLRDKKHRNYGKKIQIMDELDKKILKRKFNEPLYITEDGGEIDDMEYSIPGLLKPWYRKSIEYLLEYEIQGPVCGKIIEE